jgi:hypothetical protein
MQESQDLRIRVEYDYDPLKEFNRSWWYLNRDLCPLKRILDQLSLCSEVLNLVFSDPRDSTYGIQGPTNLLQRHIVFCACAYAHCFWERAEAHPWFCKGIGSQLFGSLVGWSPEMKKMDLCLVFCWVSSSWKNARNSLFICGLNRFRS